MGERGGFQLLLALNQSLWRSRKSPDGLTWVCSSRCVGGGGGFQLLLALNQSLLRSRKSPDGLTWVCSSRFVGGGGDLNQLLLALSLWRSKKSPSIPVVSVSKKHSSAQQVVVFFPFSYIFMLELGYYSHLSKHAEIKGCSDN